MKKSSFALLLWSSRVVRSVMIGNECKIGSCAVPQYEWIWVDEVDSTMEEARRRMTTLPFAVAAGRQTSGRGTRGRIWNDADGNVKLTVAIPLSVPAPILTLVPLRIGTIIHSVLSQYVDLNSLRLKWPNDVLLDQGKLAGTLMEVEGNALLIGVGVNLQEAPPVPTEGANHGRRAVALKDHTNATLPDAKTLAQNLADAIIFWATSSVSDDNIISDWSALADWETPLTLRDTKEQIVPTNLLPDGRLLVRPALGGPERPLVAEYLL